MPKGRTRRRQPTRPRMPRSYGLKPGKEGLLEWDKVARGLTDSKNYWVVSGSHDKVHAAPVWGLWLEDGFYFSTDPNSRKGRNIAQNPNVVVHLESGDEVAIVEGVAERVPPGSPEMPGLTKAYGRKYRMRVDFTDPSYAVYRVSPRLVLAWGEKDFPQSATRWKFQTDGQLRGRRARK